jgi:hypothetical protein
MCTYGTQVNHLLTCTLSYLCAHMGRKLTICLLAHCHIYVHIWGAGKPSAYLHTVIFMCTYGTQVNHPLTCTLSYLCAHMGTHLTIFLLVYKYCPIQYILSTRSQFLVFGLKYSCCCCWCHHYFTNKQKQF